MSKKLYVPETDPNYVEFGIHYELEPVIKSGQFFPVYITGETGCGKSLTVSQLCSKYNKPMIRVNLNSQTDEDQLIGTKTLVNGNIEIVDGPVIIAMRTGSVLLCDEIDAANPNAILCLQSIAEGSDYYFKLNNEWIKPAIGFNIIATANTKGKGSDSGQYIGTNILNEAFLERFAITLEQSYPSIEVETKIVTNVMVSLNNYDKKFCTNLVKWAAIVRKTYDEGGVSDNITTRRLIHIIRADAIYKDQIKSLKLAINRFDNATKVSFLDLFQKISGITK